MFGLFAKKGQGAMWIFAGLGNPGAEYARNRHNVGFMAVDAIAARHGFPAFRSKFRGLVSEGEIGGGKLLILKPQTFMNLSGESVAAAARFYKIPPERIVAFHDELDLPAFKVRVKKGGGNAGHNGLKSLDAHLGTAEYLRVRIGIGHPGEREKVHGYVLSDFAKAEAPALEKLLDSVAANAPLLLQDKASDFMSRVSEGVA